MTVFIAWLTGARAARAVPELRMRKVQAEIEHYRNVIRADEKRRSLELDKNVRASTDLIC